MSVSRDPSLCSVALLRISNELDGDDAIHDRLFRTSNRSPKSVLGRERREEGEKVTTSRALMARAGKVGEGRLAAQEMGGLGKRGSSHPRPTQSDWPFHLYLRTQIELDQISGDWSLGLSFCGALGKGSLYGLADDWAVDSDGGRRSSLAGGRPPGPVAPPVSSSTQPGLCRAGSSLTFPPLLVQSYTVLGASGDLAKKKVRPLASSCLPV